jgi:hypothetical protein
MGRIAKKNKSPTLAVKTEHSFHRAAAEVTVKVR